MTIGELLLHLGPDHWVTIDRLYDGPAKGLDTQPFLNRKVVCFVCENKLIHIYPGRSI